MEAKTTNELEYLSQLARIDDEIELRRRGIKHLQGIKRRIKKKMKGGKASKNVK